MHSSVSCVAKENANSRVYIGYHFCYATELGLVQGRSIGAYGADHALRPLRDPDPR